MVIEKVAAVGWELPYLCTTNLSCISTLFVSFQLKTRRHCVPAKTKPPALHIPSPLTFLRASFLPWSLISSLSLVFPLKWVKLELLFLRIFSLVLQLLLHFTLKLLKELCPHLSLFLSARIDAFDHQVYCSILSGLPGLTSVYPSSTASEKARMIYFENFVLS